MDNSKILALRKGLRSLKSSIEDFLDNMELDGEPEQGAKEEKKPSDKKFSSTVEEDEDGRKKSH